VLHTRRPSARGNAAAGVYVEGLDDVMIRLSKCCTPVPGDAIIGFVTRGRGVSVHRESCVNAQSLAGRDGERLIEVEWDESLPSIFLAGVELKALDRANLLVDVARIFAEHHVPIYSSSTQVSADRVSRMSFECELSDVAHLDTVLNSIRQLEGVYDAYRLLPGKGRPLATSQQ
jgi:guanosine-3',5'-bis(diphosphate) 3'-pyrophosphohydrolase